jgi:UPF0716 protein FxsA
MRVLGVVALLLVALGIAEVALFLLVAHLIGVPWAILLALATSVVGVLLLRREGVRGWRRFRDAVAEGRPPGREAVDGVVGLVGGLLLVVPGFISDAAGLLLLAPPIRGGVRRAVETRVSPQVAGQVFGPRLVRAKRSQPEPPSSSSGDRHDPPEAIEGEIVD